MHSQSQRLMKDFARQVPKEVPILDIGSRNVNGTFREFFPLNPYIGIDIEAGEGVDMVVPPYEYPFPDNHFEVIISGSTLEHVKHPWRWIKEVARILKPGGKVCIIVPYAHPYHEHPIDCWRIFPEGMRALFEEVGLKEIINEIDDGSNLGEHPVLGNITTFPDNTFGDTIAIATK